MMKIGRRGSVNVWLTVEGKEGHVAYPHLADNPAPRTVAMLAELDALELDGGTDGSTLQPRDYRHRHRQSRHQRDPAARRARTSRSTSTTAIPGRAWRTGWRRSPRATAGPRAPSGEAFITLPGDFSAMVARAVEAEAGLVPEASTTGGTSDARFLRAVCPVIEFGLCNATMHKRDEAVAVPDLDALARIYARIAAQALST